MLSLCPLKFHKLRILFAYIAYEYKSHIQKKCGIKVILNKQ